MHFAIISCNLFLSKYLTLPSKYLIMFKIRVLDVMSCGNHSLPRLSCLVVASLLLDRTRIKHVALPVSMYLHTVLFGY